MAAKGHRSEKNKSPQFAVTLPPHIATSVQALADERGATVSSLLRYALIKFLKAEGATV